MLYADIGDLLLGANSACIVLPTSSAIPESPSCKLLWFLTFKALSSGNAERRGSFCRGLFSSSHEELKNVS